MERNLRSFLIGIAVCCIAGLCAVSPAKAQEAFRKHGYVEIPASGANTYIDLSIMSHSDVQGVLELAVNVTCNYEGLRKAGLESGLKDVVFQTQHGEVRFDALCTCMANSADTMSLTNAYGVPGAPVLSDRDYDLIPTLALEKVTARDAGTGKKLDITRHIGLSPRAIPIIRKK